MSRAAVRNRSLRLIAGLLTAAGVACAAQPKQASESDGLSPSSSGLAVYALSRGKGVPEEAQRSLAAAREMFEKLRHEQKVVRVVETRIGLEGENRLCAEFVDRKAARDARDRLTALTRGVALISIVEEPCDKKSQQQGDKP